MRVYNSIVLTFIGVGIPFPKLTEAGKNIFWEVHQKPLHSGQYWRRYEKLRQNLPKCPIDFNVA